MLERIERGWRVFGTGLSFTAFGIGGLLLRVLVFPLLSLFVRRRSMRVMLARDVIRLTFRLFIGFMRMLRVLRYDVVGVERLERRGLLILANHPTLIDTVFLMAFIKHADCIVKSGLLRNPFTRGPVHAAGYISNDCGAGLIEDCVASLRNGGNLIVFPEGTRTPSDGTILLKRGAANVAVRGQCNVTPVLIHCSPPTLGKGERWWQVPSRKVHIRLEVRQDIDVLDFIAKTGNEALAARHLTDYLQTYFTRENQPHAVI